MPPGRYTVKLTADGQSFTQPLDVLKDPNTPVTLADIAASSALLTNVQARHERDGRHARTRSRTSARRSSRSARQTDVDGGLRQAATRSSRSSWRSRGTSSILRMTGRGQDEVRYPVKLGGQLNYLAGGISASDFTPTSQQREVDQVLAKQVKDTRAALQIGDSE